MKNLWMFLPPLLADNFGMIEVLRQSDGCGVIDDGGAFRLGEDRHRSGDTRTTVSEPKNEDVVSGTKTKVLSAAREITERYRPAFLMFSAGPCGAMIGTDLGEIAEEYGKESGLPCGVSELTGQKTYDVGIYKTLEGMAKLLTEQAQPERGCVNLIGSTTLDWSQEDLAAVRRWMEEQGFRVLAQPGTSITAEQVRQMAKAEWNLVTSVSGLAMARYLEKRFGTPYLPLAPFGQVSCSAILRRGQLEPAADARVTTLIIGEQLAGNAIRATLEQCCPGETAQVYTFYQLDKKCARTGDKKLKGEAEVRALLAEGKFERVIADPLLRPFAAAGTRWIDLPHKALHTYGDCEKRSLFGAKCDAWLQEHR